MKYFVFILALLVACAGKKPPTPAVETTKAPEPETERVVAVLEFNGVGVDNQVLLKLADSVRVTSRNALPNSTYHMLTRENMFQILSDNEIDPNCVEGQCAVETGRNIGADLIISGDVLKLDGQYLLTLKLYETDTGNLLSAWDVETSKALKLIHEVDPATLILLEKGLGIRPPRQTSSRNRSENQEQSSSRSSNRNNSSGRKGRVRFVTSPAGSQVLVNGEQVCSTTPCSRNLPLGYQKVTVRKRNYNTVSSTMKLSATETVRVTLRSKSRATTSNRKKTRRSSRRTQKNPQIVNPDHFAFNVISAQASPFGLNQQLLEMQLKVGKKYLPGLRVALFNIAMDSSEYYSILPIGAGYMFDFDVFHLLPFARVDWATMEVIGPDTVGDTQYGLRSATLGLEMSFSDPKGKSKMIHLGELKIPRDAIKLQAGAVSGYTGSQQISNLQINPYVAVSLGYTFTDFR